MADDVLPEGGGGGLRRWLSSRRLMTGLVAFVAVGGFSAIVWYAFERGKEVGGDQVAPIIKADGGPTRIRPEKPGGMKIPNQDKEVYSRLSPSAGEPKVERLLPPPPAPLKAPVRPPSPPRRDAGISLPSPSALPKRNESTPKATLLPPPKLAATSPAGPREANAASGSVKAKTGTVATAPKRKASGGGGFWVQLASHRSDASARRAWRLLKGAHRDLLGSLDPVVKRVDLGSGKGIFYRLQAGSLASEAAARMLCSKLKQRKLGCLVVRS